MGKHLKFSFMRSKSMKNVSKSPDIVINNQTNDENNWNQSEEELYSKVDKFLNSEKGVKWDLESSISSKSSEDIRHKDKQKKVKKTLREEGNKHIAELIAYLHSDKQLVETKFNIDGQELQLLNSYENAVDFDLFFEEKKSKVKDKLWRTPYVFTQRDDKNISDSSANGLHSVNRFGEGVKDGCSVSLSLASKGRIFGDIFHRSLEWTDIIEEADQVLHQYEKFNKRKLRARRGSLLQPRIIFLSPHPEVTYERVLQSANCLPLRAWTSELFLDSKESSQLMDSETKRNLKWNASVEDFRHLLSPELSHFGSDVYSMMVQAKRRMSLYPPKEVTQTIPFRRKSYINGEIWAPNEPKKHQMKEYNKKIGIFRLNSGNSVPNKSVVKSKSANNLLTLPKDSEGLHSKKNKVEDIAQTLDAICLEKLSPKVMANELTLIAQELLLSIKSTEIITLLIRPHSISPESCPDITALLGFQKRIIQLITSYILSEDDINITTARMNYFIEMAKELKFLRNWHSVYSVIMSLQSPPIARLRRCWQLLSDRFSDSYCDFIELSEIIKSDSRSLDYTSPSIPIFTDLIDDMKERCGSKFFEIVKHRSHSNWTKRETLAVWVDQQIVDLVNEVKDKKSLQKKVQKIRKNSNDSQNKGIFKRLLNRSSKDFSGSDSVSSVSECTTSRLNSLDSEFRIKSRQMLANSPMPSCKNIWSVQDFNKLREHDEKQILEEIARGLIHYQRNAAFYGLDSSNEIARHFLLFYNYEGLDNCMKKSYALEPPKRSNDTNQRFPTN